METLTQATLLLGGVMALLLLLGTWRYRDLVNPLSVLVAFDLGIITLLSAWVTAQLPDTDTTALAWALLLSAGYALGVGLPYLWRGPWPARCLGQLLHLLGLRPQTSATRWQPGKLLLLAVGAVLAFVGLAVVGGGGWLWLTASRTAYQDYRTGAGPFFAATQWCVTFGLLYVLSSRRPRGWRLLAWLGLASVPMVFLGSKHALGTLWVIGLVYRHVAIRRWSALTLGALLPLGLLAVLLVTVAQGLWDTVAEALVYFNYSSTTAQFLAQAAQWPHPWGAGTLSSLWALVPRALAPDKPFVYGDILVSEFLWPGLAERGHTPGMLPWTLAYADAGAAGVVLAGVLRGVWQRAAWEYFLAHRTFWAWLVGLQWGIWPWMPYATAPLLLAFLTAQSVFLRGVWRARVRPRSSPVGAP